MYFVFRRSCTHPDIQNMQLQPHVGLIFSENLDAVDMTEISQQGHEVGPSVDDMTDAVSWTH